MDWRQPAVDGWFKAVENNKIFLLNNCNYFLIIPVTYCCWTVSVSARAWPSCSRTAAGRTYLSSRSGAITRWRQGRSPQRTTPPWPRWWRRPCGKYFLSECEIFSGVGGHTPGVVRHKPQEMAQFACGRRRRGRRGNGTAILLLNTNNNLVKRKYDLKVGLSFS